MDAPNVSPAPGADGRSHVLLRLAVALALVLAATLPYVETLEHGFVWDDHLIIRHVGRAIEDGGLATVLAAPFMPSPDVPNNYFRPVVYFTYWLDRAIGGGEPRAAHAVNVLLHVGTTLAVAALLLVILGDEIAALAGGLVFAVHPVHVESVAWVAGRTDVLCALFTTGAAVAWVRAMCATTRLARASLLAASAAGFGLACFAKEAAGALPVALLPLAAAGIGTVRRGPGAWWRDLPTWLLTFAPPGIIVLLVRQAALHDELGHVDLATQVGGSLLMQEPGTAAASLLRMLRMLIVPWPHGALLTRTEIAVGLLTIVAVSTLIALCAWMAGRRFRRTGVAAAAWIAAFAAPALLVPAAGAVVAAERYMYLPSVGVAMLAGALWSSSGPLGRIGAVPRVAAAWVLALVLGTMVAVRAPAWASEDALTGDIVRTSPDSALAHQLRAEELTRQGRTLDAIPEFERSTSLSPRDAVVLRGLGRARLRTRDPARAAAAFRRAVEAEPDWPAPRIDLAVACAMLGDWRCVEAQRAALRTSPPALEALDRILAGGAR